MSLLHRTNLIIQYAVNRDDLTQFLNLRHKQQRQSRLIPQFHPAPSGHDMIPPNL